MFELAGTLILPSQMNSQDLVSRPIAGAGIMPPADVGGYALGNARVGSEGGYTECCICRMAILLICWACISAVVCLAFLCAAARPAPRAGEQVAFANKTEVLREPNVVSQNDRLAPPPSEPALRSSCQVA